MATLDGSQLGELMRRVQDLIAERGLTINFTKAQLYAALQVMEDWYEAEKAAVSVLLNTATSPLTLTAGQKKAIGRAFLEQKFKRE